MVAVLEKLPFPVRVHTDIHELVPRLQRWAKIDRFTTTNPHDINHPLLRARVLDGVNIDILLDGVLPQKEVLALLGPTVDRLAVIDYDHPYGHFGSVEGVDIYNHPSLITVKNTESALIARQTDERYTIMVEAIIGRNGTTSLTMHFMDEVHKGNNAFLDMRAEHNLPTTTAVVFNAMAKRVLQRV